MDTNLKDILDQARAEGVDPELAEMLENAKGESLDAEAKNIFDQAARTPKDTDIFAATTPRDVKAKDVFSGPDELYDLIEKYRTPTVKSTSKEVTETAKKTAGKLFSKTNIVLTLNIIVITAVAVYITMRPKIVNIIRDPAEEAQNLANALQPQEQTLSAQQLELESFQTQALEKATSWEVGQKLLQIGKPQQAYYVFAKLLENMTVNTPVDEYNHDFLHLKMAQALKQTEHQEKADAHITRALQSKSPVVRAMANYHLLFEEMAGGHYLEARKRAYRTLALLESLRDALPANLESDCYFAVAESITREVLVGYNLPPELPGNLWTQSIRPYPIPEMTQEQLRTFVQSGIYHISEGAVTPQILKHEHLKVGRQWSAASMDAPLSEVLSRFAATAQCNVVWNDGTPPHQSLPTTLYLPSTALQTIPEVAAGCSGLIARFGAQSMTIYNPELSQSLDEYNALLSSEGIAVWRRFLMNYRGDHRAVNAHYALGLLQQFTGELPVALSEYRIVVRRYPHSSLAPFSLMNASKIRTNMKDFQGASEDLKELLVQYPDCRVAEEASLYLAEATLQSGMYEEAAQMFQKTYNTDLTPSTQQQASYGLGNCYYRMEDYEKAKLWLAIAIQLINNPSDHRLKPAYYMLGNSLLQLGEYKEASRALRSAIDESAPKIEYIDTILRIVEVETHREQYITAMNMLQNIPTMKLSQEYVAKVLIAKARILQEMDITDTAISLLRRKIEFIANSDIRAMLSLELARCYIQVGDYAVARRELSENMAYLSTVEQQEAQILLAHALVHLDRYDDAITMCRRLEQEVNKVHLRDQALQIRAGAHEHLGQLEMAAAAYAQMSTAPGEIQ